MEIQIKRSKRRKKTLNARIKGDTMYVYVPHNIRDRELREAVNNFKKRFQKRRLKKKINREENLSKVAGRLNQKYFDGKIKIKSIEYVTNQNSIFASCSCAKGTIRISHKVAAMPVWVRDYVLVHEMAHILVSNHSSDFWSIVNRYEFSERARGFLMARGMENDTDRDIT